MHFYLQYLNCNSNKLMNNNNKREKYTILYIKYVFKRLLYV